MDGFIGLLFSSIVAVSYFVVVTSISTAMIVSYFAFRAIVPPLLFGAIIGLGCCRIGHLLSRQWPGIVLVLAIDTAVIMFWLLEFHAAAVQSALQNMDLVREYAFGVAHAMLYFVLFLWSGYQVIKHGKLLWFWQRPSKTAL